MPRPSPILLLALLLGASLAGCAAPASEPGPGGAPPAGAGPAWSFTDLDGAAHARDAPPANATVLFFMATWCSTCRAKAPLLADVHADYAARGVRFYSLDFDPTETPEQIRQWQERFEHPWPHGIDPGLSVQRAFGVTSQSSVVLLDAQGQLARKWGYGAVTEDALRSSLDEALSRTTQANAASAAPTAKGTAMPT